MQVSINDFMYTYKSSKRLQLAFLLFVEIITLGLASREFIRANSYEATPMFAKILLGVSFICLWVIISFRRVMRNQLGEKLARFVYREQASKDDVLATIHNNKKLKLSFESYLSLMKSGKLSIDVR